MQGLATGNFSFQVKAIDAAGNEGTATDNYLFAVNSSLEDPQRGSTSYWGLGWKFWLIIGGGSALVVALMLALAAYMALRIRKGPANSYEPQENLVVCS